MRFLATAALVAALAATTAALPSPSGKRSSSNHVLHEKRYEHQGRRWLKRSRVPSHMVLPMRIGLTQTNLDRGYDLLMDVSHPESSNYGKHYTAEEVNELFAPSDETVDTVRAWLVDHGIAESRIRHSDNKGWIAFDATAEEAESLLLTEYHSYEHSESGATTTSCEEYHLPQHVVQHVDYITPGVKLFVPNGRGGENMSKRKRQIVHGGPKGITGRPQPRFDVEPPTSAPNDTSTCDQTITPACIRALYQFPVNTLAAAGNQMGVFEEGDYYDQADLDLFYAKYTPGISAGTHPVLHGIDGGTAPVPENEGGGESGLDFQLSIPIVHPQNVTLFQTDDQFWADSSQGLFNTLLDGIDASYCNYSAFGETGNDPTLDPVYPDTQDSSGYQGKLQCGVWKPTNVISVSYSGAENELPFYYQQRQCNEFMKLGMQGVTIVFSSGDSGVAGRGDFCIGSSGSVFNPGWPVTCPYLTVIGATKVYPGQTVSDPESAANDPPGSPYPEAFSSGGGFSNLYSIPSYQSSAVSTYFKQHDPGYKYYSTLHNATHNMSTAIGANGGLYNRIGRGYPDVAANGDNIAQYLDGGFIMNGGTSASTPIFGGIITLINEQRLKAGKKTVGFLNPSLYSNPSILNDIKNGSNPGCGTNGFSAVAGWDPVTGLGTPNYPKMLNYFMSLP